MAEHPIGSKRLVPTVLPSHPVVESPVHGSDPQPTGTSIVYGDLGGELVFIPKARADELIAVRDALRASKTWNELVERLARCSDEAHEYITGFVEENEIAADDLFDSNQIGAIADGDWPPWPKQEMLAWVPDHIRERFGQVVLTTLNGEYLFFSEDQAPDLVAAFEADGFVVIHDDSAVAAASGW